MSGLQLSDKSLNATVAGMRSKLAEVAKDRRFSEEYVEEFKAGQLKSFAQMVRDKRARATARAAELRLAAKEHYLREDAFSEKEARLFRDYVSAAKTDSLLKLAKDGEALNGEKALILGGELRRRGQDAVADALCDKEWATSEPWRESEEWKEADLLLSEWEAVDATVHVTRLLGGDVSEPFVMTTEGAKPLSALLL